MKREAITEKINELGNRKPWNHDIELPFGIRTIGKEQVSHGKNHIKWERIKPYLKQISLEGKRVLDVGCSDGFFSIKMSESGAKKVVGIDADIDRINNAKFVAEVWKANNLLFKCASIFDCDIKNLGHFDVVLSLGILHRIPDVYTAIEILTSISDTIIFEWKASEYDAAPVLEFRGAKSKDGNQYSRLYWAPSISFVQEILKSFKFKYNKPIANSKKWRRAILISSRYSQPIFTENIRVANSSKFFLFYKYSKFYLKNIYKILDERITR